ncbi:MAG: hypothetical protein HN692_00575 [Candidatus Cloacimonetes bacterium]|nr:hypothetical protein [Candidatus Cloacimonadota bacterium]
MNQTLKNAISEEKFKDFVAKYLKNKNAFRDNLTTNYKADYTEMKYIRKRNKIMKDIKHKDFLTSFKKYFNEEIFPLESFITKYGMDDYDRQCKYCKITESTITKLVKNGEINTKRIYSRGRTMEIDQKEPNGGYTKDNIALACYWCNNAKTDEFNKKEFKKIGKAIRKVWERRLEETEKNKKIKK